MATTIVNAERQRADRPNLLIIMSDQHNAALMGHAGDPFVRTPNLDRLAASGVSFTQTYCAAPLCLPSRMSFLTGRYPSDLQIWTNNGILPSRLQTFAHALTRAGCETVLCGRMHFNGPDQNHGFERRLVGDVNSEASQQLPSGLLEGVWSMKGCGQTYEALLEDAVGPGRTTYEVFDDDVTKRACAFLQRVARPQRVAEGQRAADDPFCLLVGMLLPHCPYVCDYELFEEYMDKLPTLEGVGEFPASEHLALESLRRFRGTDQITPEQARRARAAYFGLITTMDRNVGRILSTLDEQGLTQNTVVCYLFDHGDMAGEHGLWAKDCFYEGSVRVPMIWSWPRTFRSGCRVDNVVGLLDVAPTLMELAGTEFLPGFRGQSLRRFLEAEGPAGDWPDTVFSECLATGQRPARMIRSGRWKLNVHHGYEAVQLFDMEADSEEKNDLGRDPACADLRRDLVDRVLEGWCGDRIERQVAEQAEAAELENQREGKKQAGESERWIMREGMNIREKE